MAATDTTGAQLVKPIVRSETPVKHITANMVVRLLGDVARGYTRHHADLVTLGAQMGGSIALSVQGHMDDHGRLIGSSGSNIWALQTVFKVIGGRMGQQIRLTLVNPKVGTQYQLQPFKPDAEFKHGPTTALLVRVLTYCLRDRFTLTTANLGDSTAYEIEPSRDDLPLLRADQGNLATALHNLFHAIGKTRGRIIHVTLKDTTGDYVDADIQHARALDEQQRMSVAEPLPPLRMARERDLDNGA